MRAFLEGTGEPRAGILRPGNAGAGTAAAPVTVRDAALAQLPVDPPTHAIIGRADSAGGAHTFLDHCATPGRRFIGGPPVPANRAAPVIGVRGIRWIPALTADGTAERDGGEGAEVTARVDLTGGPPVAG